MPVFIFANEAQTSLALPIQATDTQILVAYNTGSTFPVPSINQVLQLTLVSATNPLLTEIVWCTNRVGDTLTVIRGQEGTIPRAWNAGDYVANLITAGTNANFVQVYQLENATYNGAFLNVSATTGQITNSPINPTDIANKSYVDIATQNLIYRNEAQVATTPAEGNITLAGLQTIDGYTTVAGDFVLVKNQTNSAQNGVYVASSLAWSRASFMSEWNQVPGFATFIQYGAVNASTGWVCIAPEQGTINVTPIVFEQFTGQGLYLAGTGLTLTGNVFSVTPTGVTAGSYGTANSVPTITLNAEGQSTLASNTLISIAPSQINAPIPNSGLQYSTITIGTDSTFLGGTLSTFHGVNISGALNTLSAIPNSSLDNSSVTFNGVTVPLGLSGTITANTTNPLTISTGLSGGSFNGSSPVTISITPTGVTAGTYGSASSVGEFTVNAEGQIVSALSNPIQISYTQVSGLGTMANQSANNVSITGGTITSVAFSGDNINNTPIGSTNPSTGAFTTLSASGPVTLSNYTGYLFGNGSGAITSSSTIPTTALSGTVTNAQIQYPYVTLGTTQVNLGSTASSLNGLTSISVTQLPTSANQLATKQYVDDQSTTGFQIHTPILYDNDDTNLAGTYANGGTTVTVTAISSGSTLTATNHGLLVGDVVVPQTTSNGLVSGTPYFVFSVIDANNFTLSLDYFGTEITTFTNGTGLSIALSANSGVGATLTGTNTPLIMYGVTLSVGNRVLLVSQTNGYENGAYTLTQQGSGTQPWILTRATDSNKYIPKSVNGLDQGSYYLISGGTDAGESYVCTFSGTIIFGTTNITFSQFSQITPYTAGTGLTLNNYQFSITNTGVTASTYGTASSVPTITVNAQGQLTSASNTPIAISASQVTSGTFASSLLSGTYSGITGVGTLTSGVWNASTITVPYGGTGATSLTGYVYGNGTGAMTASTTIPNTAITGLGTLSTQNANNVTISGGTIDGTAIGSVTPALITGTTITATTQFSGPGTGLTGTASNLSIGGNAFTATKLQTARTINGVSFDGTANITITADTPNSLTFDNSGTGATSPSTFNGSAPLTISYNSIGAPSTTGTNASGTWNISITGNAATATTSTNISGGATNDILYQTGAGATGFITAPTVSNTYLYWNGTSFAWATVASGGTVTSVAASGGTTGLSFTGSPITTSGTLTLTGTLNPTNGGTGTAGTLTGYVYANGSSPMTASTTIPNTSITGLGTMSTQNANNVTITGGTIDGTTIGKTTPALISGTTITATTQFSGPGTGLTGTASGLSIGGTSLNITSYPLNQSVATSASPTFAQVYTPIVGGASGQSLSLQSNGVTNATLDTSGNLYLGNSYFSWGGGYHTYANQLYGDFYSSNGGYLGLSGNAYFNGTNWIYKNNTFANRFESNLQAFQWLTAPSGTAGSPITFTQAMTLDNSGNLLVGTTTGPSGSSNLSLLGTYYDASNTAYYVKPSGTSNLSSLDVGGSPVVTTGNISSYAVTSATAGTGISVSGTNPLSITNTGIISATGGTGINVSGTNPLTINLSTTGVTPGTYGSSAVIPVLTVNSEGQITSISTQATNAPAYQGVWNASTNTPTITSGTGTPGYYYVVSVAGNTTIDGTSGWNIGDWIIFENNKWEKIPGSTSESFTNLTTTNLAITGLTGYVYANGLNNLTASTTVPGSVITGDISGNATNITSYPLNQSVATTASPNFANLTIGASQVLDAANVGSYAVTSATGGTGISVTGTTGPITVTNTGIISAAAGSGISVSGTNPLTITNTGVTSITAGTGISVSSSTGSATITNTGVLNDGGTYGINISGYADHLFINGSNASSTWNWAGQGGQPPWLWGGSDGTNFYVYNPSNFSVNYANTAGNGVTVTGGSPPYYGARAWVNFYGNGASIRGSANVSSISRTTTGGYTVYFSTNMPDTNFCAVTGIGYDTSYSGYWTIAKVYGFAVNYVQIESQSGGNAFDSNYIGVAIFR